jgi:hypothetical protein
MGSYILSNSNRFYVALEQNYGQAVSVTRQNRFPAVRRVAQQVLEHLRRHDKTGTRTFYGTPLSARRSTGLEVQTYLTSWQSPSTPAYGPLFQAALGGTPRISSASTVRLVSSPAVLETTTAHGLQPGSALSFENEIRFASAVPSASTIVLNAPFSGNLIPGSVLSPAWTYSLATSIPSVTLYDYWDPSSAIQRLLTGAAIDSFDVSVNGDFHEFSFRGAAADIIDSTSFSPGEGGLQQFPAEPDLGDFDYSIVPGHLGQAWLGGFGNQVFTLTAAHVQLKNNLELRHRKFGATLPRAISPGLRSVVAQFSLLAQTDAESLSLYQAARSRSPTSAMLQLGQTASQLMGIYLPAVTPEIPIYNDAESRLQWDFHNCQAQGKQDDELFIAFA